MMLTTESRERSAGTRQSTLTCRNDEGHALLAEPDITLPQHIGSAVLQNRPSAALVRSHALKMGRASAPAAGCSGPVCH